MLAGRDFDLDGAAGGQTSRFTRELPERWCYDGRAFGGYTSALALAAVFAHSGRSAAASLSVTFVEAGTPGPLELDARTVRSGRTAEAVEVTLRQDGRTILSASSWLADGWQGPPSVDAPVPFDRYGSTSALPDPLDCPPLDWVVGEYAWLEFARRRSIDYPDDMAGFHSGRPEVALWVRADDGSPDGGPDCELGVDPLTHPQIADVLHADAHLFDAPGRVTGFVEAWLLSLDLSLVWQPGAHLVPSTAWRLVEAKGSVASGGVTAYGSLRGPDGSLLAVLTSQGLLR